ncbi:MAG TPA: Gfo/Idh/MocA family oxidoreductase, partial [Sedimentisphaerales bacterium]|nr:Gfo/Idh/MocA family oxidoreductase [Sedimentisphaerales bacterium]
LAQKYAGRAYGSYEDMLDNDDIDIVTIATPSGLHMQPTVAAAKAGKHVICEKPIEITLERIDTMIEAHAKAGTRLGGIFPYRFNDMMVPLREAIRSGRLGTITCASVYVPWWRTDAYYEGSWRGTWELDGGGALMNQSIHMIDMLCDLMPPIESVQAFTATLGHKIQTEDVATAVVRYTSGALGMIYGTTASYPGQFRRFEITGTKGTIINVENSIAVWQFADEKPQDAEVRARFTAIQGGGGVSDPAAITHENHTRNFKAFLESLETGKDFWISGPEARKAVEVILAIYRSAKEGRLIKLR